MSDDFDPEEEREAEALRARVTDAIAELLAGTTYAPADGGIVTDVVVIVGFRDARGIPGWSYLGASTSWATEGLLAAAYRRHATRPLTFDNDSDD